MLIRKEQLSSLVASERRTRLSQRVTEWLGSDPRARRGSSEGEVIVADSRGKETRIELTEQGLAAWTTPRGRRLRIERDPEGRATALRESHGSTIDISYSRHGSIRRIDRNGGPLLAFDEPRHGLLNITYADGVQERLMYDGADLVQVRDANGHQTHFTYDDQRKLVGLLDAAGRTTRFEHDDSAGPVAVTYADGSLEELVTTELGDLELRRNGGAVARLSFDPDDNLQRIAYHDGHVVSFQAPSDDRFEAATPEFTAAIEYDDAGRVVCEPQGNEVVRYTYDRDDNLIALETPRAGTLRYGYDGDDQLIRVTDWDGRVVDIAYAPSGQISSIRFPNGVVTEIEHDVDSRARRITTTSPADTERIVDDRYVYDARDRVTEQVRRGRTSRFTYDRAGQLLGADQPNHRERFAYDATGNRTSYARAVAAYDARDRILSHEDTTFAHDDAGNLTRMAGRREFAEYRYNGQGHLIEVRRDGLVTRFAYDAFGRRIRKTVNSRSTHYVWSGRQLLHEWTAEGTQVVERRDYLYYPGEHLPLAVRINDAPFFYHTDRIGTVLALTDGAGRVVWRADYTALGLADDHEYDFRQPLRLPGHYHDVESGLHYNLFRYYSPELGRYLTPDPLRYGGGRTNFYVYANNDPINQTDPDGHIPPLIALAVVAGAALVGGLIGGAINAAMADDGKGWDAFKQGFKVGAVGGAIGAAVPIVGAALGLGGAALAGLALAGDAASGGVTSCMEEGVGVSTFLKGAGIALATTIGTFGLAKIPGVKKALGAIGKRLAGGGLAKRAKSLLRRLLKRQRPVSKRLKYMGATPSKKSATGKKVIERMRKETPPRIRDRGGRTEFKSKNGKWYPIEEADMSHKKSAVEYWNEEGYKHGPKSQEVRRFMLDAKNYELELNSINRSEGAAMTGYRDPH